jgi:predicted alpha/beta hydrolase
LVDALVIVSSGSGYWKNTAWPAKRDSFRLFQILVPLLTPLFGYFPGKRMRVIGDIPKNVIWQWRKWCWHPDYFFGFADAASRADYKAMTIPMLSYSFTDDDLMSATSTEALHKFYANAPIEHRRFTPAELDAKHIGHFGFYREDFSQSLWRMTLEWINQRIANSSR